MYTVSQASTNTFLYSHVCGDGGERKSKKKRDNVCACVCGVCVCVCDNVKYRKKRTGTSL